MSCRSPAAKTLPPEALSKAQKWRRRRGTQEAQTAFFILHSAFSCVRQVALRLSVALCLLVAGAATSARGADTPQAGKIVGPTAADLSAAVVTVQEDLRQAIAELQRTRQAIDQKRAPMARAMQEQEARLRELRGAADRLRAVQRQKESGRRALEDEFNRVEEDSRFIFALLSEYRRSLATRAGIAETALLENKLAQSDRHLTEAADYERIPVAASNLLATAAQWNRDRIGGITFEGICLDANGLAHPGRFAVFGPQAYFAGDGHAGLVMTRLGSSVPALFSILPPRRQEAVAALVGGREAVVPLDVSSGTALRVETTRESVVEHIVKGGFVMIPILLVAVAALALTVMKFLELRRLDVRQSPLVDHVLGMVRAGDIAGAELAAAAMEGPLTAVVREAFEYRNATQEQIEEIMHERIIGHIPRLERHLGALAVLGGVAPLLGLLGTVTGMIHTFHLVTLFGASDPRLLSSGISEALITTEYGLYVAIPVLLVHAYLSRRVRSMVGALEGVVVSLVNELGRRKVHP
ncbi:MAG: MotA/TolQ/ExbB proton channel family protein [Verrucomicrobiota bacterium]|nr:MotA/TolQ/ExbB proton channel family protein [Verrucomicrobiota bacterium]